MAITFRHFLAMSERRFAANRVLIRRSPARRRIEQNKNGHSTFEGGLTYRNGSRICKWQKLPTRHLL